MSWVTLIFVLLLFQGSAAAASQTPGTGAHFISYDTLESRPGISSLSAGTARGAHR